MNQTAADSYDHAANSQDSVQFTDASKDDAADSDWNANGMSPSSGERSEDEQPSSCSDFEGSRRKRKAKQNGPPKRPRVDTLMTRKLRSAPQLPYEEPEDAGKPTEPYDAIKQEGSDLDIDMDDAATLPETQAEPVREVSEEQARADLEKIQNMWEMGSILSFLQIFESYLKLNVTVTSRRLEMALVRDAGPGLLAELHMDLLRGCCKGINISPQNWAYHVARKLLAETQYCQTKQEVLLALSKGREALAYAALPVERRVLILKALCEVRLMREDLKNMVDGTTARKDRKKEAGKGANGAAVYNVDDYRWHMFGKDSEGSAYWLYDPGTLDDTRLYRDRLTPERAAAKAEASAPKRPRVSERGGRGRGRGKSKAKAGAAPAWVPAPTDECGTIWELACDGIDAMKVEVQRLQSSGHRTDGILGKKLEDIVSHMDQQRQVQERKRKTLARREAALHTSFTDWSAMSSGRPQRQRKVINYAFTDYDQEIKDAIRIGEVPKKELPPPARPTRRSQQPQANGHHGETRTLTLMGDSDRGDASKRDSPQTRSRSVGNDSPRQRWTEDRGDDVEEDEGDGWGANEDRDANEADSDSDYDENEDGDYEDYKGNAARRGSVSHGRGDYDGGVTGATASRGGVGKGVSRMAGSVLPPYAAAVKYSPHEQANGLQRSSLAPVHVANSCSPHPTQLPNGQHAQQLSSGAFGSHAPPMPTVHPPEPCAAAI